MPNCEEGVLSRSSNTKRDLVERDERVATLALVERPSVDRAERCLVHPGLDPLRIHWKHFFGAEFSSWIHIIHRSGAHSSLKATAFVLKSLLFAAAAAELRFSVTAERARELASVTTSSKIHIFVNRRFDLCTRVATTALLQQQQ